MTDILNAVKQEFHTLQKQYNKFCKEELNPWILSNPTASSAIAVAAIGAAVAAVIAAGPIGLIAAIPLLLVAAKIVKVAGRNFDTFRAMFNLEMTRTKNQTELAGKLDPLSISQLQNEEVPNVLILFAPYSVKKAIMEKIKLQEDVQDTLKAAAKGDVRGAVRRARDWFPL